MSNLSAFDATLSVMLTNAPILGEITNMGCCRSLWKSSPLLCSKISSPQGPGLPPLPLSKPGKHVKYVAVGVSANMSGLHNCRGWFFCCSHLRDISKDRARESSKLHGFQHGASNCHQRLSWVLMLPPVASIGSVTCVFVHM